MSANYVGILLITYNDSQELEYMLPTFEDTVDYPTYLHIIDEGSTDDSVQICTSWIDKCTNPKIIDVHLEQNGKLESLTKAMNRGFRSIMARQECEYIGWAHGDMRFEWAGWLSGLVQAMSFPEVGKVSSYNTRDHGYALDTNMLYEGHEQCYLIKRGVLYQVGLFDEQYLGIGGYEDWDLNNRIRNDGFKTIITTNSQVYHAGMGTRGKRDNTFAAQYNKEYYTKKWGKCEESL